MARRAGTLIAPRDYQTERDRAGIPRFVGGGPDNGAPSGNQSVSQAAVAPGPPSEITGGTTSGTTSNTNTGGGGRSVAAAATMFNPDSQRQRRKRPTLLIRNGRYI